MSQKLKEIRDQQSKLVVDARAKLDSITPEMDAAQVKEIEVGYDKIMAEYDRLDERAKREEQLIQRQNTLKQRQDELEQIDETRRPNGQDRAVRGDGDADEDAKKKGEAYRAAFRSFLCSGVNGLSAEERNLLAGRRQEIRALLGEAEARAQGVGTAGAGGALVPEGFMAELVLSLKAFGPMNDAAVVRQIMTATGASMPWPTLDDTSNKGRLIAENAQVTTTDVTFSTKTLDAYKYSSDLILVSAELLQDSALDVEGIVRAALAERIGRILNEHFTVGTGSGQPNGIVTASSLGVTLASTTAITADEIIDLEHSVDPAYRASPSCRFMFNDTTFKAIRKLKDGQNNYLWQAADIRAGAPSTVLGYPYSINQDILSSDASPTEAERIAIFGAMDRYVVRFVRAFAVRRLEERYADYDQIGFVGFTRADGELLDTAAVKHMITTA